MFKLYILKQCDNLGRTKNKADVLQVRALTESERPMLGMLGLNVRFIAP